MDGVRVTGIDAHCSVQVLWQYFGDKGELVKFIYYPLLNNDAVVLFSHPSGTTKALTSNHEKWKVSPLPNQVFRKQSVWVESDLSVLVQATEPYQDALRNLGQLDLSVDSRTQEIILSGQPYQIEWAWNYLSTLRDNQFHIARTLQTGAGISPVSGLSNGSADLPDSTAFKQSYRSKAQSPRLNQDAKVTTKEKTYTEAMTGGTSFQPENLTKTKPYQELSPRSSDSGDDVPGEGRRSRKVQGKDAGISSIKHVTTRNEEQDREQSLDARERRRRQEDANETFNRFTSLGPSSSMAAFRDMRDALRTGPPSQRDLEVIEAQHKLDRHVQSLDYLGSGDDYQVRAKGYQSLQPDYERQRKRVDADGDRTYAGERSTSYLAALRGTSDLPLSAMSTASAELSHKEFQLGKRLKLKIYLDNIIRTTTQAVVNAANWELKNIGGVAGALARAAGPEMADECDKLRHKHGSLATAQVVKTKAYGELAHLKCVIHTVGPIYTQTDTERSIFELVQTFYNCLDFAETQHLTSLTFPFISTGIFGMPVEHCIVALVTALKVFTHQRSGNSVEEIHFVNNDVNVVCEAIIMTEQRLGMETVDSALERFEKGKKLHGRYVFPYCQSVSSASSRHSDRERNATWDSSHVRHVMDREGTGTRRSTGRSSSRQDEDSREPWSLPQYGTRSDSRHRSSSLDRGSRK